MENISCMRFKYLGEFLTDIGDTYTDKNGKIFRISRSARNKLSTLRLCKIDSAKTVRATYDPSSNAVDLTVSGYVYDSVLEDMKHIKEELYGSIPPQSIADERFYQCTLCFSILPIKQLTLSQQKWKKNLDSTEFSF